MNSSNRELHVAEGVTGGAGSTDQSAPGSAKALKGSPHCDLSMSSKSSSSANQASGVSATSTSASAPRPFGARIREEMRRMKLNQTEFGKLGGVSKATQVSYENDATTPQVEYLNRLHAAGVDVRWIMTGLPKGQLGPQEWALIFEIMGLIERWAKEEGKSLEPRSKVNLLRATYAAALKDRKVDPEMAKQLFNLAG